MTVAHHLGLEGARTLPTRALQLAQRTVEDIVAAEAMGVVHGPAGTGKTFACQTALERLRVPVCAVQFPSRPSMLRVAQVLVAALTGAPAKGSRFALSDRLMDLLADQPRLIVIDEAQWLNRDCIEYLRHLHDDPATRSHSCSSAVTAAGRCSRASRCCARESTDACCSHPSHPTRSRASSRGITRSTSTPR